MTRTNRRRVYEAPLNVDIPVDLREEIDAFCDKHRTKIKQLVELALRRFMTAEGKKK